MEPNHPASPVAALAEATPSEAAPNRAPKLRRRERDSCLRRRIVQVRCNDEEYTRIRARAEAAGVSPPRLLVELALLGPAGASERDAVKRTMGVIRRQIVGMATNLNQLAKWANTREKLPPALELSLAAVQRMEAQLAALLLDLRAHHP
jgi:hypothetical protein